MKTKLTRQELYELVWSTPLITLAKQYNISDNGLRKMCIRMNIPLPKTGHWQRVQHSKRTKVTPLPGDYSGDETVELEVVTAATVRGSTMMCEVKVLQHRIELELGERLIVPQKLTNPDKLTHATRERFLARGRDDWQGTYTKYPDHLSISTSDAQQARALRFFDTFIKALRFRGHDVQFGYRRTQAILFGKKMDVKLNEKNQMIKELTGSYPSTMYKPTGILYLTASPYYRDKVWTDGKLKLEEQLSLIIAYFEVKARVRCEETRIREIEQQKEEEEERIRMELEQRQELELQNFKVLLKITRRWQQLKLIRGYIDELEAKSTEQNLVTEEIKEWIEWVRKKADWYDPDINAKDPLLDDVDKETLTFSRSR